MSINWVMRSPSAVFTPLPGEERLWKSPPRVSLTLQSLDQYPANQPTNLTCSNGILYLTNQRVVYIPQDATPQLSSFAAPLTNMRDSRITAPWFGPNVVIALVEPVPGGGLQTVEARITFKDGGGFDFHTGFVEAREKMQRAVELAREQNPTSRRQINFENVHLDQLPAYSEAPVTFAVTTQETVPTPVQPPREPPPGYEQTQQNVVAESLQRDSIER